MIVGIDLGTTHSLIGAFLDGKATLFRNPLGDVLTPSAVSIDDEGTLLVGRPARDRLISHPASSVASFKRWMGSPRLTRLGDRDYRPEELSALVIRSLLDDAETALGTRPVEAVISVPAYFSDAQRRATRRAGELAGLRIDRLINEPTAAALAYGLGERLDEAHVLVLDLGGGTFDVSILELFDGVIEVRASTGDNRLGGEDFNDLLIAAMRTKIGADWPREISPGDALHELLRAAAEKARRTLTTQDTAIMSLVWKDKPYEFTVTADEFETMAAKLIARLREPVLRSLRDSETPVESLKEIVLVGGSTRMPVVRRAVTKMFSRFPSTTVNPDEAVAIGAAVQAGLKARHAALSEVVLTDVCPYSLGIGVGEKGPGNTIRDGVFSPIIERNTTIPASREQVYSTLQDGQRVVAMDIYQGESRAVTDNVHLGKVEVPVPAKRAGEVPVHVRFSYDINGLLEVDVHVPATGERRNLVIIDDDQMSPDELARRQAALAGLKVHPRENDANRAALARAARCYEDHLGERRDYIGAIIGQFESVLDRQDPRAIDEARAELLKALDAFEGETWL